MTREIPPFPSDGEGRTARKRWRRQWGNIAASAADAPDEELIIVKASEYVAEEDTSPQAKKKAKKKASKKKVKR